MGGGATDEALEVGHLWLLPLAVVSRAIGARHAAPRCTAVLRSSAAVLAVLVVIFLAAHARTQV